MNYSNYYPASYQPAYYPQVNAQNQQQSNNGMIWVVGEGGADSYLVAPNQTVQLWDSTAPVFYLKSADGMGRPSKRIFDYTERGMPADIKQIQPATDFASKDDISHLQSEIEALRAKFDDMEGGKKNDRSSDDTEIHAIQAELPGRSEDTDTADAQQRTDITAAVQPGGSDG